MADKSKGEHFREFVAKHPKLGTMSRRELVEDYTRTYPDSRIAEGYAGQIIADERKAKNAAAVAVKHQPVQAGPPDYKSFFDMIRDVRELSKKCGGYDNLIAVATRLRDEGM